MGSTPVMDGDNCQVRTSGQGQKGDSGAAKLTYCAFNDESMKFGTLIHWIIPVSFGLGDNLEHA